MTISNQSTNSADLKKQTAIENQLVDIWKRVLKTKAIDNHTPFLHLGGNSIDAIQIIAGIKAALSISVPVMTIFQHDTIAKLAAYLAKEKSQGSKQMETIKPHEANHHSYPLSAIQHGLYFLRQKQGTQVAAYNVYSVLDIEGLIDNAMLSEAFNHLIKRHDILQAVFPENTENPVQQRVKLDHDAIDLLPETVTPDKLETKTRAAINTHIALGQFPLLHVQLFKLSDKRYRLVIVQPHIITDGWSLQLFTEELFTVYAALIAKKSPDLPAIPMPYFHHVLSDKDKHTKAKDLKFWQSTLAGIQTLTFPTDYPRPHNNDSSGKRHDFFIQQDLLEALNHRSSEHHVTSFMWVATVLNRLLSYYCAQEDIVMGFPISRRDHPELERTMGPLINTLVLRTQLAPEQTFTQLLAHVKENCLQAYAHPTLPFHELVNALNTKRTIGVNPIFQVMLVWQDWYESRLQPTPDITVKNQPIDSHTAKFDLTFEFIPTESGLHGFIEYKTSLFRSETIKKLADHFVDLLKQCIATPSQQVKHFSLACSPQAAAYLPKKATSMQPTSTLKPHQYLELHAQKNPGHMALINKDMGMSYADLNRQANQLAHYIQAHYLKKLKPNKTPFIGLLFNKSPEVIISLLAILKAGAAYVPIDIRSPEQRIQLIASDANLSLIITHSENTDKLQGFEQPILFVDQQATEIAQCPEHNLPITGRTDDPIYVIYTSGTTGRPKGVIQTHGNVARLFHATHRLFEFSQSDTWLFFHSHAFDFSVWEIWGALLHGGQLVIPEASALVDPNAITQLIKQHHITVLNQTPSAFRGFMPTFIEKAADLSSVRAVIFGGEAFDTRLLSTWWEHFSDTQPHMVNMYGITETTVHTTYKRLLKADLHRRESSNIGVPLDDMQILIVDELGKIVPVGVPGELLVGGEGLALGYLNQPALTAQKFIKRESPLTHQPMRFYRTGDLVRCLSDNTLEYLGRIDQQIKFKGFRIETAEIERALEQHPKIAQAAVTIKPYHDTEKLVAYFTLKQAKEKTLDLASLRSLLSTQLPGYMMPNLFIELVSLPLTGHMKIHYAALPSIEKQAVLIQSKTQEAMTTAQKHLVTIWEHNLNVKPIGLDDNFFSLGGDSMTALKVVAQMREQGLSLGVSHLYQYQTIREITTHSGRSQEQSLSPALPENKAFAELKESDKYHLPEDAVDAYPMAALQLGMLYHTRYSPETAVYLDVFSYIIQGAYHHADFVKILKQLIAAHPILRTTFHVETYAEPLQVVHQSILPDIKIEELTSIADNQERQLKDWMEAQKQQSFDFETGPLFRITIHQLTKDTFHLGMTFHHAILDGWSVATFITTLLNLYTSLRQGKAKTLPVNTYYRAFIQQEQQAIASADQRNFWQAQLTGFEGTDVLAWGHKMAFDDPADFLTYATRFDQSLTQDLLALSKTLHVSIDVVLLTGLIKLLAILTDSQDVLAGVVFNGRPSIAGIENTLGLFLNTLPFRHKLIKSSWKDLILAVSHHKSDLYPYRRYPLMQIQKDQGVDQLFNLLFYFTHFHVYQDQESQATHQINIIKQTFYERTNFPLTFNCSLNASGDELTLFIHHETALYPSAQVQTFSAHFLTVLRNIVTDVQADHENCTVISPTERQRLLVDWNQTGVTCDLSQPIHRLIEQQAQKTPHHVAVTSQARSLTYETLDAQANYLANTLRTQGAKAGEPIAIYMSRGIETMVAVLAVFKLGGVYVPIDTIQPQERLSYILGNVKCRWILSDQSVVASLKVDSKQHQIIKVDELLKSQDNKTPISCVSYGAQSEETAYILYTSGSTGKPKGVMVSHAALLNLLFAMNTHLNLSEKDNWLALTSFSFDISLLEIFLPLLTGGTCIIANHNEVKDPQSVMQAIKQQKITCLQATPTTWKMLFDAGYQLDNSIKALSGGEPLTPELATRLARSHAAWNVYGPTETTIWSTCLPLPRQTNLMPSVSIGKPLANTKIYVLNRDLKPVPIGVPGELYISGLGVATGYLHQAALTEERFIHNPFDLDHQDTTYAKLYKTGDSVCWMPDGHLYFMGRNDHQFKLRGFRIEAGEIESALLQHPAIKSCVVLVKKIDDIDCLLAYISLHQTEDSPALASLKAFLADKVPHYMLPKTFIVIDAMPTTVNGKIDINALRALSVANAPSLDKAPQEKLSDQQQAIATIWSQVLHIQSVSPKDSFFDIGGNSILSLIVVQRINEHFAIELSIRELIEYPTLSALSELITEHKEKRHQQNSSVKDFTLILTKKIPNPIITLRETGELPPLFFIHPIGGTVFYYLPLVKRLAPNRPVYAIQDPGIVTKDRLFSSLTEMIRFYIMAIKKYQPTGPYYIAGSSFGANAAVEMARQLQNENEHVAFTGLIDGWAKYPDRANNDKKWFENNLRLQLNEMKGLLPEVTLIDLLIDLHWDRQQLLAQHSLPTNLSLDLTLFKAEETLPVLKPLESPYNNWEHYCTTPPKTYPIPGDHFTVHFEPHIDKLAAIFNQCLTQASHELVQ